jgi:hypothetical protein
MGAPTSTPLGPGDSDSATVRDTRGTAATGFVLLCGAVALLSTLGGGTLPTWYSDPFRGTPLPDPSNSIARLIGKTVELPRRDQNGRQIPKNRRLLLAPAPCGSCSRPGTWIDSVRSADATPIVAIFPSPDKDLEAQLERNAPHAFRVQMRPGDPIAPLVYELSPSFAATDPAGKIIAVSAPLESLEEFGRRAGLP